MSTSTSGSSSVFHIIAFCFGDKSTAGEVMKQLEVDQFYADYRVVAHAVVEVDEKGKTHVHEPGRGGRGFALGAISGGLLALIGGPLGLLAMAVAGGTIGGIVGKHFGKAIPEEDLKELGDQLDPNSSALLALIEDTASEALINGMKDYNAKVITLTVGDEVSGEIATAVAAEIQTNGDTSGDSATEDSDNGEGNGSDDSSS